MLDPRSSLLTILEEMSDTRVRLEADPVTASLTQPLDDFLAVWQTVFLQEIALNRAQMAASARGRVVDRDLNFLIEDVDHALRSITHNNRDDLLYKHFFGNETPSSLKAPVLGDKVTRLQTWVAYLQASNQPALLALLPRAQAVVARALQAISDKADATTAVKTFRVSGARKTIVDRANGIRKDLDAKLTALSFDNAALHLPSGFSRGFFRVSTDRVKVPTVDEIDASIAAHEAQIEELKAERAKTIADLKAAEQAQLDADAAAKKLAADTQAVKDAQAALDKTRKETAQKEKDAKKLKRKVKGRSAPPSA